MAPAGFEPDVSFVMARSRHAIAAGRAAAAARVRRFIAEDLAEKDLLTPAERPAAPDRLLAVVAGIVRSDPTATLRAIAARLEAIREPTPRGGTGSAARWRMGSRGPSGWITAWVAGDLISRT
jgi:hypothetical protein